MLNHIFSNSHKMFSLAKIAYHVCNQYERRLYNNLDTVNIDLLACCETVLRSMKTGERPKDPLGDVELYKS